MAKYQSHTKSGECVFCKIVNKTMHTPGIYWESDNFMAFLSIFPNTEGVTVVIPKDHYGSDVLAMPDDVLKDFVMAAKEVSKVLENYFKDVGRVGLVMEGTGIDHAHIKLFPMHGTDHMKRGEWKQYPSGVDTYFEDYKGYIASNDGPRMSDEDVAKLAEGLKEQV